MNMQAEQKQASVLATNQHHLLNNSFMLARINTASLIQDIKNFLSSVEEAYTFNKDTKEWIKTTKVIGLPMANPEGIMRLCNIVRMRVNNQVAQANIKSEHYWEFIARARKEITETIIKKCYDWDVDDSNLNMIIDEVCALIELFITRPIDNKEREGYEATVAAKETIINTERRKGMSGFTEGIR